MIWGNKRKNTAAQGRIRKDSAPLLPDVLKQARGKPSVKPSVKINPSVRPTIKPKTKIPVKPSAKTVVKPVERITVGKSAQGKIARKSAHVRDDSLNDNSMLWRRDAQKRSRQTSIFGSFARITGGFFSFIFRGIFYGFQAVLSGLTSLFLRSKLVLFGAIVLAVFLFGALADFGLNWGKIYPGVSVGDLDLGGKTSQEAQKLLEDTYASRLNSRTVYVFADEKAAQDLQASLSSQYEESSDQEKVLDEAQEQKLLWRTDTTNLDARLDTQALLDEALAYGRENGGILNRLQALFSGHSIDLRVSYGEALEALTSDISATIGNPLVNYDISVLEGNAVVVEGHDGEEVNRAHFAAELNKLFFNSTDEVVSLVAKSEHAPLQIDWMQAQKTCDQVNASIELGTELIYQNNSWAINAITLGSWIKTRVEPEGDTWKLVPYFDYEQAKGEIQRHFKASYEGNTARIRFALESGEPIAHSESKGTIPKSREALDHLSTVMFGGGEIPATQPRIQVEAASISSMKLQEALDSGVVSLLSEYTTEYTSNVPNRNHNIHLAADLLDQSIIPADGGVWSFNETAGNCNEEAGFRGAGSIIDGEIVDEIGGGICQVATTVFNAVYEGGYPIVTRSNHSLYIAGYPAGRDAAVSWPDLDLQWKNDTPSDILLCTRYTESSITVALYGVNLEYTISTQVGEWVEGKKFETITKTDETLTPGSSYIKTPGVDASSITIVRMVKDKFGNIVREDSFTSFYDSVDEVKIEGPKKEEAEEIKPENSNQVAQTTSGTEAETSPTTPT